MKKIESEKSRIQLRITSIEPLCPRLRSGSAARAFGQIAHFVRDFDYPLSLGEHFCRVYCRCFRRVHTAIKQKNL